MFRAVCWYVCVSVFLIVVVCVCLCTCECVSVVCGFACVSHCGCLCMYICVCMFHIVVFCICLYVRVYMCMCIAGDSVPASTSDVSSIRATPPMLRCSRIMHTQRDVHPTILCSLEGIVDQVLMLYFLFIRTQMLNSTRI